MTLPFTTTVLQRVIYTQKKLCTGRHFFQINMGTSLYNSLLHQLLSKLSPPLFIRVVHHEGCPRAGTHPKYDFITSRFILFTMKALEVHVFCTFWITRCWLPQSRLLFFSNHIQTIRNDITSNVYSGCWETFSATRRFQNTRITNIIQSISDVKFFVGNRSLYCCLLPSNYSMYRTERFTLSDKHAFCV